MPEITIHSHSELEQELLRKSTAQKRQVWLFTETEERFLLTPFLGIQHVPVKPRWPKCPSPAPQVPGERFPLTGGVSGIHSNICHLQGVPKPADVGQSAVLMEFSFLPAESAPLHGADEIFIAPVRRGIKANLDITQRPK